MQSLSQAVNTIYTD